MSTAVEFRKRLEEPGIIVLPGIYDGVGARVAQQVGFEGIYVTGNGLVASRIGKPDIGLATMSEMANWMRNIVSCVEIPVVCDADNGYGGVNNVKRTVEEFEAAGVAAIHIEDQIFPKQCAAIGGLKLISTEDMVSKIKVALKTRKDMAIIARTDIMAVTNNISDVLDRIKAFENAGADVVFAEMITNPEDVKRIVDSVKAPVLFDIFEQENREEVFTVRQLEDLGVKIVFNCLSLMRYNIKNTYNLLEHFRKTGSTKEYFDDIMELHSYENLMGLQKEREVAANRVL